MDRSILRGLVFHCNGVDYNTIITSEVSGDISATSNVEITNPGMIFTAPVSRFNSDLLDEYLNITNYIPEDYPYWLVAGNASDTGKLWGIGLQFFYYDTGILGASINIANSEISYQFYNQIFNDAQPSLVYLTLVEDSNGQLYVLGFGNTASKKPRFRYLIKAEYTKSTLPPFTSSTILPKNNQLKIGETTKISLEISFGESTKILAPDITITIPNIPAGVTVNNIDHTITVSDDVSSQEITLQVSSAMFPEGNTSEIFKIVTELSDVPYEPDDGEQDDPSDDESDNIEVDIPDGSVEQNDAGAGIYSRWLVSPAQLADMADYIWQQPLDVLTGLLTAIVGKPIDAIIQLTSYPFNVGSYIDGSGGNIKIGNLVTDTDGIKLSSNSGTIDWGTISMDSVGFANHYENFLDFSPYTQYKLYLPWGVGFVDIDANDIIHISNGKFSGGSISVKTNFEIGKGTAVHNVYNDMGIVIGSYCCDIGRTIPVIGSDYASKSVRTAAGIVGLAVAGGAAIAGASSAISGAVASATTSKLLGMASLELSPRFVNSSRAFGLSAAERASAIGQGLADTLSSIPRWHRNLTLASAAAVATGTPNTYRNGVFLEGSAGMNIQYPYLIITKPDMSIPENYGRFNGYPSNIYATLGSLRGYTEVAEIHLRGLNATVSELAELEDILKGGVIL